VAINSAVSPVTPSLSSAPDLHRTPYSLYSVRQQYVFLAILFLVSTSNYFDYYILSVVLEPIKHEFHVSDTMLGLLSGVCFALVYAVAGFPIARWADRGNRRTIITLALGLWSVVTVCCGLARSFGQLAVARFGLGLVEPAALPPSQSLLADYFPPERRATALAVLTTASAAGYLFGVALGGYIAETHGWRSVFLFAGVPGTALAILVPLTLSEPRLQLGFPTGDASRESAFEALRRLYQKRSFLLTLIGISTYCVLAYGLNTFLPSFMIRTLHASLTQVSVTWGTAICVASAIGAVVGGFLADRLSKLDVRWYGWLPAVSCFLGMPLYWAALASNHLWTFIAFDFLAESIVGVGIPVAFAAVHAVCGNRRRATAVAAVQFSLTLFGAGLGPLLVGMFSDALGSAYGADSLRHSLFGILLFLLPAAAAFFWSGLKVPQDLES
jgi:predicted MFS family arabinose efflux permease